MRLKRWLTLLKNAEPDALLKITSQLNAMKDVFKDMSGLVRSVKGFLKILKTSDHLLEIDKEILEQLNQSARMTYESNRNIAAHVLFQLMLGFIAVFRKLALLVKDLRKAFEKAERSKDVTLDPIKYDDLEPKYASDDRMDDIV